MKIKRFTNRKPGTILSASVVNERFVDPLNKLWEVQTGDSVKLDKSLPQWTLSVELSTNNPKFGNIRIKNFETFFESLNIEKTPELTGNPWDGTIYPNDTPNKNWERSAFESLVIFDLVESSGGFRFSLLPTVVDAGESQNDWMVWVRIDPSPFGIYTYQENPNYPLTPGTLEMETF